MPIYEYRCRQGHTTEEIVLYPAVPRSLLCCSRCGSNARRIVSMPVFSIPEVDKNGYKIFKGDPWEGTALEGSDGVNEVYYKSDKVQVDLGK